MAYLFLWQRMNSRKYICTTRHNRWTVVTQWNITTTRHQPATARTLQLSADSVHRHLHFLPFWHRRPSRQITITRHRTCRQSPAPRIHSLNRTWQPHGYYRINYQGSPGLTSQNSKPQGWVKRTGVTKVSRLHQHCIGYLGEFYRSKDPTNSIKELKEV